MQATAKYVASQEVHQRLDAPEVQQQEVKGHHHGYIDYVSYNCKATKVCVLAMSYPGACCVFGYKSIASTKT